MRLRYARFGALCGVFFVVALTVGNQMVIAGEGPANTGPQVLANLQRPQTAGNAIGWALALLSFPAFLFFVGYLRERLRGESDWLAGTAVAAAAVTVAIKFGSVAFQYAAQLRAHDIGGVLARSLVDLGDGAFVIAGLMFSAFVLAAALAGLCAAGRPMPRWLAWPGLVLGVLGLITPLLGVIHPGSYLPLPWLLQFLWTGVLAVVWTIRPQPGPASPTVAGRTAESGVALEASGAGA